MGPFHAESVPHRARLGWLAGALAVLAGALVLARPAPAPTAAGSLRIAGCHGLRAHHARAVLHDEIELVVPGAEVRQLHRHTIEMIVNEATAPAASPDRAFRLLRHAILMDRDHSMRGVIYPALARVATRAAIAFMAQGDDDSARVAVEIAHALHVSDANLRAVEMTLRARER